jgi:hypothetical protein
VPDASIAFSRVASVCRKLILIPGFFASKSAMWSLVSSLLLYITVSVTVLPPPPPPLPAELPDELALQPLSSPPAAAPTTADAPPSSRRLLIRADPFIPTSSVRAPDWERSQFVGRPYRCQ